MHITYDLPVAIDDIIEAKQRLAGRIYKTGMPRSNYFSERCKGEIFLKFENMQRTGSFKIRGAFNKLSSLTDAEKRKGVVACSAGNHAQGVSLSCAMLGIDGKVVMPKGAPKSKVAATCDYSAEVVLHGDNFNDTIAKVSEIVEMEGRIFIPPYDDPKVIAGQGTIGLEIMEDLYDVDNVIVPIGGGGFTSTPDNNFITQVNNARSRMSDEKKRATKYVFLIDMLNDIRAQNSVTEQAGTFFSLVRQYFPNATIYVLPVTYNEASLNEYVQMARSCVSRTYEVINAGKAYGAIVCEGSRSWLHFGKEQAKSWDQGVDNVHMTDAGYRHVRQLFVNWIHGGPSFLNPPSYDLHPLSASTVARDYNYLNCERHGDFVNIQGTFRVAGTDVGYDAKLMDLPGWARPYDGMMSPIIGNDRTYKYVYVAKTGGMHAGDILKANQTYQVNMTYRIF